MIRDKSVSVVVGSKRYTLHFTIEDCPNPSDGWLITIDDSIDIQRV